MYCPLFTAQRSPWRWCNWYTNQTYMYESQHIQKYNFFSAISRNVTFISGPHLEKRQIDVSFLKKLLMLTMMTTFAISNADKLLCKASILFLLFVTIPRPAAKSARKSSTTQCHVEKETAQLLIELCMTSIEVDVGYIDYRVCICACRAESVLSVPMPLYSLIRCHNHFFSQVIVVWMWISWLNCAVFRDMQWM